ncbi:MAG: hypothetical protein JWO62_2775 [Acidimicrobiaceae bacterium]|nr:hypothetical protein [Acidimicrobiaceae bacterium]
MDDLPHDLQSLTRSIRLPWAEPLPVLIRVRRKEVDRVATDIDSWVAAALEPVLERVWPGCAVAVTAGSRGFAGAILTYRAVGRILTEAGARPFLVAAMGSHGGGTADGRLAVLGHLGVTEEAVGMPVVSGDGLTEIREVGGAPVWVASEAFDADLILAVNRIKAHTDFSGPPESGLAKILAVGLGKQRGANAVHSGGPSGMPARIISIVDVLVRSGKVLGGLAVIEDDRHEVAKIVFLEPSEIGHDREAVLLDEARAAQAMLPFEELDVLVVNEIGKQISGTGMDPHVIGRMRIEGMLEPVSPRIAMIAALRLSEESGGNGIGLGLADVTTSRVVGQLDPATMYLNALTAGLGGVRRAAVPIALATERDAVSAALSACGEPDPFKRRVVCILNTLQLQEMLVSESLRAIVEEDPLLEIVGEVGPMSFDEAGDLSSW